MGWPSVCDSLEQMDDEGDDKIENEVDGYVEQADPLFARRRRLCLLFATDKYLHVSTEEKSDEGGGVQLHQAEDLDEEPLPHASHHEPPETEVEQHDSCALDGIGIKRHDGS